MDIGWTSWGVACSEMFQWLSFRLLTTTFVITILSYQSKRQHLGNIYHPSRRLCKSLHVTLPGFSTCNNYKVTVEAKSSPCRRICEVLFLHVLWMQQPCTIANHYSTVLMSIMRICNFITLNLHLTTVFTNLSIIPVVRSTTLGWLENQWSLKKDCTAVAVVCCVGNSSRNPTTAIHWPFHSTVCYYSKHTEVPWQGSLILGKYAQYIKHCMHGPSTLGVKVKFQHIQIESWNMRPCLIPRL